MIYPLFTFLSLTFAIIWSIIFLPTSYYGFRIYKINGIKMAKFAKMIKYSSILSNDEPEGWIYGFWFFGYIYSVKKDKGEHKELWLLCSKKYYNNNFQQINIDEETGKPNKITYWNREGSFWHLYYNSRLLNLPRNEPNENQLNAINQIIDLYNKNNYVVSLLYGNSGSGKSMTTLYLCSELLKTKKIVNLCDTHMPCEYGDNFDSFYTKINPNEDSPLVIVFEEVDNMIQNIHDNKITNSDSYPTQIKNKTDWNTFLDKFDRDMYPYTILIMTSNKDPNWFDRLDHSYLRKGRVGLKIKF